MGLEVGITACLGEKFWQLWHTSSNGGRLVNRQKPCRSVYLLHFPSACKLFHINIPLFIFLSVRASTWTMLQKKREKPWLWSIGCAPEGDVFARMSVGTSSKLLSNFAESLKTQDNKDDEDRGKNMSCIWRVWPQERYEILREGVMHTYVSYLRTVDSERKRGQIWTEKDAQNLILNNPSHRFNSVLFTANVHKSGSHSIPLLKLTFSLSPWPKVEKFRKLSYTDSKLFAD